MACGIYKISLADGRCYVGSSKNMGRRLTTHRNLLNRQRHHSEFLQKAWNKYGENAFLFLIIEECPENQLQEREQLWMDLENSEFSIARAAGGRRCETKQSKDYRNQQLLDAMLPKLRGHPLGDAIAKFYESQMVS